MYRPPSKSEAEKSESSLSSSSRTSESSAAQAGHMQASQPYLAALMGTQSSGTGQGRAHERGRGSGSDRGRTQETGRSSGVQKTQKTKAARKKRQSQQKVVVQHAQTEKKEKMPMLEKAKKLLEDLEKEDKKDEKERASRVTYYRVQGGVPPKASWRRITIRDGGSIAIERGVNVNISTGNILHAKYFLKEKRPGGDIVAFNIPQQLDDFIKEYAIPQYKYSENPENQGGLAPKVVDPTTPGDSYEFPPIWSDWLEIYARDGRILKEDSDELKEEKKEKDGK